MNLQESKKNVNDKAWTEFKYTRKATDARIRPRFSNRTNLGYVERQTPVLLAAPEKKDGTYK